MNPGPARIDKIGKIKVLTTPLQVHIRTIAPGIDGPGTFDIHYSIKNVSKRKLTLDLTMVSAGIIGRREVNAPNNEIDPFLVQLRPFLDQG